MIGIEAILQLLAPFDCLGCSQEGTLFCKACRNKHFKALAGYCYRCLSPVASSRLCPACRAATALENVWVAAEYDALARQLVQCLKFGRARSAAQLIAQTMHKQLPAFPAAIVVPIPTANRRVRERGYDQASLIAHQFAKRRGLFCQPLLRRQGSTRQVGANRTTRRTQLQGAFYFAGPSKQLPGSIILVDDVLTTGATIEAAAIALKEAGAAHVSAALFAHKHLT